MSYILAVICLTLMLLSLILIFMGLPGNWVIIALTATWAFWSEVSFGWQFFALIIGLAALGEILEFMGGIVMAKRFGGTGKGNIGGIIGAIIGAIVCAPILFGLGALPGALAGGFAGCFILETISGMKPKQAFSSSVGTVIGRFGGFVLKLGIGVSIICMSVPRIWSTL
jgi:uncharacterized protein YqgC (DUF456 family)